MKTLTLLALGLLTAGSAQAQIRAVCTIDNQQNAFVAVSQNEETTTVALYVKNESLVRLDKKDIFELNQNSYRLNLLAAHHNTVIKISSDIDLFGGDSQVEGEETWKGLLYLSPNLAKDFQDKNVLAITCSDEI